MEVETIENRFLLTLDFKAKTIRSINFVQNNVGSSVLELSIVDGGQVTDPATGLLTGGNAVDITDQVVSIAFLKPDNTLVIQDITTGVSILGDPLLGKVQCILMSNTLAAAGVVKAEVSFSKDGNKLSTTQFNFTVSSSLDNGAGVLSSNQIPVIDAQIEAWQAEFDANEVVRDETFATSENARVVEFEIIKAQYDAATMENTDIEIVAARDGKASLGERLASDKAENATVVPSPNGVDDTISFKACLDLANGKDVRVPAGIYIIDGLNLPSKVSLIMDDNAVLLAKPNSPTGYMFTSNTTLATIALKIRGGTIDGNKLNQTGRPAILIGYCPTGSYIDIQHVTFKDTVRTCVNISGFGGLIDLSHNKFIGQAEATGIDGEATSIMSVMSGEPNADGFVRFNHNVCIGTATPAIEGGSPGGIFMCNRDDVNDLPHGNISTLEAIGNYFYGYGLHVGVNDISPIHTYPSWGGARVIGNYFEKCGFCAISGKTVINFVCSNNIIINGQWSAKNVVQEGAISYVPGYTAGSYSKPRATITGNIIDNPGGQSGIGTQYGIAVHGTATSYANDVIVANNVMDNIGTGVGIDFATNVNISGNIINSGDSTKATAGSETGIRLDHINGDIMINNNRIVSKNGPGVYAGTGISEARLFIIGNMFKHLYTASFSALLRGLKLIKLNGNTFDVATGAVAVDVRGDGINNVKHLIWDESNTVLSGATQFGWTAIDKVTGSLRGTTSPLGIITPGEIGTKFVQTDGKVGSFLWQSLGVTKESWVSTNTAGLDSTPPTVATSTGAGTGATASVVGSDLEGQLTVTTGTACVNGGAIVTVTFNTPRNISPKGVIITPANGNALVKNAIVVAYNTQITTIKFALHTAGGVLVDSTPYIWYYKVLV